MPDVLRYSRARRALCLSMGLSTLPASARSEEPTGARAVLASRLDAALSDASLSGGRVAGVVLDAETGEVIWERDPDRPQNPASCEKLITTLVALDTLGPEHVFTTEVRATAAVKAGTLDGDLYVVGDGDPELYVEHWWALARLVRAAGVTRITGGVVIDPYALGEPGAIPGWAGGDDQIYGKSYEAMVSGLALNFNSLVVHVGPGDAVGDPIHVWPVLESRAVRIDSTATTVPGAADKLDVRRHQEGGAVVVTVRGSIGVDAPGELVYRSLPDPMPYAATTFEELLEREGVAVEGAARVGRVPAGTTSVATFPSRPVWVLAGDMNKYSSNHIAELLLRASAVAAGRSPTAASASEHAVAVLNKHGIDPTGAVVVNGSGLSRNGKLTPRQLAGVVRTLANHPLWGHEAMSSLAVYGRDGTVKRYLRDHELVGRVRVKTGTVRGVLTLSGHVACGGGRPTTFSVMYEDLANPYRARGTWDDVVTALYEHCQTAGMPR